MEHNHILGMVCGYYLSRFDQEAYAHLGHPNQRATHKALGAALNVSPESIKNWRDEFDPVHDNPRQGWHKREMYPSRRRTMEALDDLSENELHLLIKEIIKSPDGDSAGELVSVVEDADNSESVGGGSFQLRGSTGIKAEEAFLGFHQKSGEPVAGKLMDRRHDQCGFDFEIISDSGYVAVEVKGLAGRTGGITFTDKEWLTAKQLGTDYYLALVHNVASEPEVSFIRNPAAVLEAQLRTYTVVQVGWSVGESSIRKAEKT